MNALPYGPEADGQGVRLAVRLSPRASRNAVEGVVTGADGRAVLSIKLNAPPVDGAANEALGRFIAEGLGLARSAVVIKSGHTARQKLLRIAGAPPDLLHRFDKWLNPAPSKS